jgi:hypothetical protein
LRHKPLAVCILERTLELDYPPVSRAPPPNGKAKLRGRFGTTVVDMHGALVSFSDHWAAIARAPSVVGTAKDELSTGYMPRRFKIARPSRANPDLAREWMQPIDDTDSRAMAMR